MDTKQTRTFDGSTVSVHLRDREQLPACNVKVRKGLDDLKPEQWEQLRADADLTPEQAAGFTREWAQAALQDGHREVYFWEACKYQFEQAEQDAKALFGERVECYQDGRSGGWLVVKGLPDVEEWNGAQVGQECANCAHIITGMDVADGKCESCDFATAAADLPDLKDSVVGGAKFADGTPLQDNAGIWQRWAFFQEQCDAYAQDVAYVMADLLLHSIYESEVREKLKREQEKRQAAERREALHALAKFGDYILGQMLEGDVDGKGPVPFEDWVQHAAKLELIKVQPTGYFLGCDKWALAQDQITTPGA